MCDSRALRVAISWLQNSQVRAFSLGVAMGCFHSLLVVTASVGGWHHLHLLGSFRMRKKKFPKSVDSPVLALVRLMSCFLDSGRPVMGQSLSSGLGRFPTRSCL
jgi:hypothetical protein